MVVTLAYIALFLVFSWVILRINQKSDSLSKSVFIAIFLGAVIGLSLHFISANHTNTIIEWYSIVGNGYVHLLKLVAIPLIFISILSAINKLENSAGIGKMSLTIVGCMLCLVMVAGFIGLLTAHILGLDASAFVHMPSMLTTEEVNKTAAVSIPQLVTSLIPTNIFLDLTGARSVRRSANSNSSCFKRFKYCAGESSVLSRRKNSIASWVGSKSVDISSSLMCKRAQYITFFCAHFDQKQYASHFYGDNVTQSP